MLYVDVIVVLLQWVGVLGFVETKDDSKSDELELCLF